LCHAHYTRLHKHGDPLAGNTPRGKALEFFIDVVLPYTEDDCLIWPFSRTSEGYARVWHEGRLVSVHRLACERIHGPPPTDKHEAAHSCGNGHLGCVNPRHLSWKTRKENEADKILHGTIACGKRHGSSKLTADDVREIQNLIGTMKQFDLAKIFGISQSTISDIKRGKLWRHLKAD